MGSRARGNFRAQQAAAEAWAQREGNNNNNAPGGGGGGFFSGWGGGGGQQQQQWGPPPPQDNNNNGGGGGGFFSGWGGGGHQQQHQQQWGAPPPQDNYNGGGGGGFFSGWGGGGGRQQHQHGGGGYGGQRYPPQQQQQQQWGGGYDDDGRPAAPAPGGNGAWGPFANIRLTPTTIAKLFASLLIDAIGFATYAIPVLGEAGDAVWAPISGFLIYLLYGNIWLAGAGFIEEMMPGLDFIPTATLAWVADNTGLLRAGQQFGFLRNLYSMFGGGGGGGASAR